MAQLAGYSSYKYFAVTSLGAFVAHVEINRPAKLNAFLEAMWQELRQIFQQLSTDPEVRVVVLSGAGDRAFTAGLDVQAASQNGALSAEGGLDSARAAIRLKRYILDFQDCITAVEKCEKPVISVMHGISIGLAIDLSCATDIRIAAKDARFSVKEVDIGMAADIGTLARLPKAVSNASWVKEVCLSARFFGATEALSVGFVSQVHESKTAALNAGLKLATLIASKSPVAVQGTKEILNHARDHTVEDNLYYTAVWNSSALQAPDMKNALLSGIQKTKPRFEKL